MKVWLMTLSYNLAWKMVVIYHVDDSPAVMLCIGRTSFWLSA